MHLPVFERCQGCHVLSRLMLVDVIRFERVMIVMSGKARFH